MQMSRKLGFAVRSSGFILILVLAASSSGCLGEKRPTPVPVAGFELLIQRGSQPQERLLISADGSGCETLPASLSTVCLLTTNLLPNVIGGEAHGGLNNADTPSLTALIWRARIDDDVSVCEAGGLIGERRTRCEQAAHDPHYAVEQGDVTVVVPLAQ